MPQTGLSLKYVFLVQGHEGKPLTPRPSLLIPCLMHTGVGVTHQCTYLAPSCPLGQGVFTQAWIWEEGQAGLGSWLLWLFGKETQGPRNPGKGLDVGVLALCTMGSSPCEEEHTQPGTAITEASKAQGPGQPLAGGLWAALAMGRPRNGVCRVSLECQGLHGFICNLGWFGT